MDALRVATVRPACCSPRAGPAVCGQVKGANGFRRHDRAFLQTNLASRASSDLMGSANVESPFLRWGRTMWNGQRSTKRTSEATSSVIVYAAAAAAVEEAPAVTTESVPLPTKVGKGVVRIRLTRLGRKKRPFFRIVATHYSWRRDGKYIELLGHYNPLHGKDDLGIVVKADRIKYWLGVGAQPSDTVKGILHKVGIFNTVPQEA